MPFSGECSMKLARPDSEKIHDMHATAEDLEGLTCGNKIREGFYVVVWRGEDIAKR